MLSSFKRGSILFQQLIKLPVETFFILSSLIFFFAILGLIYLFISAGYGAQGMCMLGKCTASKLHPHPSTLVLYYSWGMTYSRV
jgi:hypothetical protein